MLTDNQVENLIKPLIKRQELMNLDALRIYGQAIKQVGEVDSSNSTSLLKKQASQPEAKKLRSHIDDLIAIQLAELIAVLTYVAEATYNDSKPLYDYRNIEFIPFKKNKGVQTVLSKVADEVESVFKGLYSHPSYIIRDLKNPQTLTPTSVEETYQSVVNECVQSVQNNPLDYNTVMRRTSKQLINSGLTSVYYDDNGNVYTQRMDSAVRNNILDGIKLVQQNIEDEIGEQVDSDGKELSAHQFSAPDHEPFQGHMFTNENWDKLQSSMDFQDVDGQHFMGVERIIGVWNCRHFAISIILGYSKPTYTKRQLQAFIDENNTGYTLPNGKHLTMYECTQRQRQYEYRIRQAKTGLYFAKITGDKMLQNDYKAKIANRISLYEEFSNSCGLPTDDEAINIVTK